MLYKEMDNEFDVVVQDRDQQPVDIREYSFLFRIFDRFEAPLLTKDVVLRPNTTNRLIIDVNGDDIAAIDPGFYNWGLVINENGRVRPLYLEHNGAIEGALEIGVQ